MEQKSSQHNGLAYCTASLADRLDHSVKCGDGITATVILFDDWKHSIDENKYMLMFINQQGVALHSYDGLTYEQAVEEQEYQKEYKYAKV